MRFWVIKHPALTILFTLFITASALFFIPRIRLDNSVEVFCDKKSPNYTRFQEWKSQFGNDQFIIIAFSDKDIFTQGNLSLIYRLTERLENLKYVEEVTSLATVNDIIGSESDFIVEPLMSEVPASREEARALKKQALANPIYLKDIISNDGRTASILVELENRPASEYVYKTEVMEKTMEILKEEFPEGKNYYISGPRTIEHFYTDYMKKDLATFLPLIILVIIIILALAFRTVGGVLLPLSSILIALSWTMGILYAFGFNINNITTIIPPIVLAIALADSVHFVGEGIQKRRLGIREKTATSRSGRIRETMEHLMVPCFLTSVTTSVGFFSLTVSKTPPVRELGLVIGIGVLLAFFITFTFLPAMASLKLLRFDLPPLKISPQTKQPGLIRTARGYRDVFDEAMKKVGNFNERRRIFILAGAAFLIAFSVWGMTRIRVETSMLEQFRKRSFIYRSTDFIEKNLSGVYFLNVSLEAGERDYFKDPAVLEKIEVLQGFLDGMPRIDKTNSAVDYIKEINKSFHNEDASFYAVPPTRRLVSQYLLLYGARDLHVYIDSEWKWATVRARLNEHSTRGIKDMVHEIEAYLGRNFPARLKCEVLGWPVLEAESNDNTTNGQIQSLSLAMLIIFGMMFLVFRSVPVGLVSIIPNILPILINFGIMGILGIRLDAATSIISAIAIGIIVDDTIHFLYQFGKEIKEGKSYQEAMHGALLKKGRPIVFTSMILFFGFGIVAFSNFVPTMQFGLLTAGMMVTALLADLIILPALLLTFKPRFR